MVSCLTTPLKEKKTDMNDSAFHLRKINEAACDACLHLQGAGKTFFDYYCPILQDTLSEWAITHLRCPAFVSRCSDRDTSKRGETHTPDLPCPYCGGQLERISVGEIIRCSRCAAYYHNKRAVAEVAADWTYICGVHFARGDRWFLGTDQYGQYIAVTADPAFAARLTYAEMNELWGALAEIYGKENVLMERVRAKS